MKSKLFFALAYVFCNCMGVPFAYSEDIPEAQKPVTEQLVNTLTKLAGGPHSGYRSNHAKGVVLEGHFTPSKEAATITKASHLQSIPSKVTVRFSDATGVPNIPDANGNASPKGIAIRFNLPKGVSTDIVSISSPVFPVATPEDFLEMLNAVAMSGPDAPKPNALEKFLGSHPAAMKFVKTPKPAPVSFGNLAFYGLNAFKFTNAKGETHFGRYIISPVDGEKSLSAEDVAKAAPNYLMDEVVSHVNKNPIQFDLSVQLAQAGDEVNDVTVSWPETRKIVQLGVITIESARVDSKEFEKTVMFNPLNLVTGIEPSNDPILLARPAAYGVSYARRLSNQSGK